MLYTDLEGLALAATQIDTSDEDQIARIRHLIRVYWDAYYNPPEDVVGVGAITYAQEALISAQINTL